MKTNGFFEKHSPKLFREAVLRSALCGMAVGFSAATLIGMIPYGMTVLLINGFLLLLGGGTVMVLQVTGVIKSKAKGAAAA